MYAFMIGDKFLRKFWKPWVLIAFLLIIWGSLLRPVEDKEILDFFLLPYISDKFLHLSTHAFMVLPLGYVRPKRFLWLTGFFFLAGILIEFIQPYFGRYYEVSDMIINGIGLCLGLAIGHFLKRILENKLNPAV